MVRLAMAKTVENQSAPRWVIQKGNWTGFNQFIILLQCIIRIIKAEWIISYENSGVTIYYQGKIMCFMGKCLTLQKTKDQ